MEKREFHPVANIFPLMSGDEFESLTDDIRANGLREAIWLHQDGRIIDGRNRYRACEVAAVEPEYRTLTAPVSLVAFVSSMNLKRRHLNAAEKVKVAVEMLPHLEAEAKERQRMGKQKIADPEDVGQARDKAAELVGVNRQYISDGKKWKQENPDVYDKLGRAFSVPDAKKEIRRVERETRKNAIPDDIPAPGGRWELYTSDILNAPIADGSLSWIITDPPYAKEHLEVWNKLGLFAATALKRGGSLIAMAPQSYLPEIIKLLGTYTDGWNMKYQWTLAYLTPGGQSAQLWDRKVNTFWKPLLWYTQGPYSGDWVGDACNSTENDKQHHKWGQSVGGMAAIIERFTVPGDLICDPFCGAGTTGVAAIKMNRLFVGIDIDSEATTTARGRLVRCSKEIQTG
jgi:site-specific DNA-methyltransferase (adenine-specific)